MSDEISFNEFNITPPSGNYEDLIRQIVAVAEKAFVPGPGFLDLLGQFITPQLERSRREWELQVYSALKELNRRQEGILVKLYNDAEFQSLLRQAFIISWKSHKVEKFVALKAAITNAALSEEITFDNKELYLRLIDELTSSHLIILKFIQDFESRITAVDSFEKFYNTLNGSMNHPGVPIIDNKIELSTFRAIMKDLDNKGLILISSELSEIDGVRQRGSTLLLETSKHIDEIPFVAITKHGRGFLTFINDPD